MNPPAPGAPEATAGPTPPPTLDRTDRTSPGRPERHAWLSNLLGVVALVVAVVLFHSLDNRLGLDSTRLFLGIVAILTSGYFFAFRIDADHAQNLRSAVPIVVPIIVVMILAVLHFNTSAALHLALEDGPLENLQAVFLLGAAVALVAAAVLTRSRAPRAATLACVVLAAGFAFVGMEEISWGQRIFGLDTIGLLEERNRQGENTLHNLNSTTSDLAFYLLSFVLFVVLPFFADQLVATVRHHAAGTGRLARASRRFEVASTLELVLPARWLLLPFCLALAVTHDERNYYRTGVFLPPLYLVVIGLTVMVLLRLVVDSLEERPRRTVHTLATLVLFMTTVVATTYYQDRRFSWKMWMTTEYRETIVTIGVLAYALDVLARIVAHRRIVEENRPEPAEPSPGPDRPPTGDATPVDR